MTKRSMLSEKHKAKAFLDAREWNWFPLAPLLEEFEAIPGISALKTPLEFEPSTLLKPADLGVKGFLADAGDGSTTSSSVSDGSKGDWGKVEDSGPGDVDGATESWRRSCTSGRSTIL